MSNCAITLTFGDVGENHVGMQKIGESLDEGISYEELRKLHKKWDGSVFHDLSDFGEKAAVLVIPEFMRKVGYSKTKLFNNLCDIEWDTKYYDLRRNRVLNKHARYNLCFGEESQEPDYENKKGRIVSYNEFPRLEALKDILEYEFDVELICEGNKYYDVNKCGIGYHGDSERMVVIAVRLGAKIPLHFQWYHSYNRVGKNYEIDLNPGDLYIMSEKAVGNDWKRKNIYTLRHAAGCKKYI